MAQYGTLGDITPELVTNLDSRHQQRIKKDVEFGYIDQDIAEFKKSHKETSVSLVEKERVAEREANDEKQLARLNERRAVDGLEALKSLDDAEEDVKAPDAFLDETVYITLDLVDMERVAKNQAK